METVVNAIETVKNEARIFGLDDEGLFIGIGALVFFFGVVPFVLSTLLSSVNPLISRFLDILLVKPHKAASFVGNTIPTVNVPVSRMASMGFLREMASNMEGKLTFLEDALKKYA